GLLYKPNRAIGSGTDAEWARHGHRVLGDRPSRRDPPDFARKLSEPERAIRSGADEHGTAAGRRHVVFGNHPSRRDAADLIGGLLGKPERAVRTRRDSLGSARKDCRVYTHLVQESTHPGPHPKEGWYV